MDVNAKLTSSSSLCGPEEETASIYYIYDSPQAGTQAHVTTYIISSLGAQALDIQI